MKNTFSRLIDRNIPHSPFTLLLTTLVVLLAVWAGVAGGTARAAIIVVPNSLATIEGNGDNLFPFSSPQRYQQIFGASEFTALSGPAFFTQIAFRPSIGPFSGPFSITLPSVQIHLSTTSAQVDNLSTTFFNNIGPDQTLVFNGALSLSSNFTGPAAGPKAFDTLLTLQTPFPYNPAVGNLLLDIANNSGTTGAAFADLDLQSSGSDSISRLYSNTGEPDATVGQADSAGLVVAFITGVPNPVIPEPSTWLLLGSGLAGLVAWRRKKAA